MPHRWAWPVAFVVATSVPALARGANGNMPRTPVLYPPHACLTMVDRTRDPVMRFAVHLPFEDTMITADELPDSRRVALVGLCRDLGRLEPLPNWIATDDAQRALDAGIIDAMPPPADVLLEAPGWAVGHDGGDSCVQAILAERLPIACAATMDGVAWDTTAVPAGNYVIRSQTFAPPSNLWTARSGVVQIHDGTPMPVATLSSPTYDAKAFLDDGYQVRGCMAGPAGTVVTLQWASTASEDLEDDAAWTTFDALDVQAGIIDVHLDLPEQTLYLGLLLRAVATGPDGARWIGQAPSYLIVYPGTGVVDPTEDRAPDHCEAGGDDTGWLAGEIGADGTAGGDDVAQGCACAADGGGPRPGWAGTAWALALLRIRRPRASCPRPSPGWPRSTDSCNSVPAVGRKGATA